MKSRPVLMLGLLVLAALLAGCELPEEINQGWRESAFVPLDAEQFGDLLFPFIACLVPLTVLFASIAISRLRNFEAGMWFGVLLVLALVPSIVPLLTELTKSFFWPESFDLASVMSRMGWTFPLPEGDLNPWTLSAAMVFTITLLPILHSTWQLVVLFVFLLCLVTTIITKSTKPLSVAGGAILGWLFFPTAYNSLTKVFEAVRPEGAVAGRVLSTVLNFNLAYIVLLTLLMMLMYVGLPLLALIAVPSSSFKETEENGDGKIDLRELLAGLAGIGAAKAVDDFNNGNNGEDGVLYTEPPDRPILPPPYEEGEYREVDELDPDGDSSDDPSGYGDGVSEKDYLAVDEGADEAEDSSTTPVVMDIPSNEESSGDHLDPDTALLEGGAVEDSDPGADQVSLNDELDISEHEAGEEMDVPDGEASTARLQELETERSPSGIHVPSYKELSKELGAEDDPEQTDKLILDDLPRQTTVVPELGPSESSPGYLGSRLPEVEDSPDESDKLQIPEDQS